MPESKRRKKPSARQPSLSSATGGNPPWFLPAVLGLLVVGLLWVVVYYLTSGSHDFPVPPLGRWNLAVGFGMMLVGFGLLTRWK